MQKQSGLRAICKFSMCAAKANGTQDTSTARTGIRWIVSRLLCPNWMMAPTAVHCKSGYRSMIAASLLQRAGHDVINVIGGFDAWDQA